MQKYKEVKSNDMDSINSWFAHCRKDQIPYILIKKRKKYSSIEWDYITYASEIDNLFSNKDTFMRDNFKKIFDKYANEKSSYEYSSLLVTYDNIYIEDTYKMAEDLFDFIHSVATRNI